MSGPHQRPGESEFLGSGAWISFRFIPRWFKGAARVETHCFMQLLSPTYLPFIPSPHSRSYLPFGIQSKCQCVAGQLSPAWVIPLPNVGCKTCPHQLGWHLFYLSVWIQLLALCHRILGSFSKFNHLLLSYPHLRPKEQKHNCSSIRSKTWT